MCTTLEHLNIWMMEVQRGALFCFPSTLLFLLLFPSAPFCFSLGPLFCFPRPFAVSGNPWILFPREMMARWAAKNTCSPSHAFAFSLGEVAAGGLGRPPPGSYDGGRGKELWSVDAILGSLFRVRRPRRLGLCARKARVSGVPGFSFACDRKPHAKLNRRTERTARRWPLK